MLRKVCMICKVQSAIALFTCGCLVSAAASPSSIGFVVTSGEARVDGAAVQGNSTLFAGSQVQSGIGTSDLMVSGASNLLLQPGSSIKVFREYAVLQHGIAVQRRTHGYALVAAGLKVSSLSPQGAVVVDLKDSSHLEVAAQGGAAEVRNPAGGLVARLEPGKSLSFLIQAAQQTPALPPAQQTQSPGTPGPAAPAQASPRAGVQLTLHGVLRKDHPGRYGHFLLTDTATNITYELQGAGLDDLVGASVEVTGSTFDATPAEGASQVVSVADIHQMPVSEVQGNNPAAGATPPGERVPPNGAPGAEANPQTTAPPEANNAPSPPPIAQHSDTAKILVIVGLAAGAVVGVALGLGGGKSSTVSPE